MDKIKSIKISGITTAHLSGIYRYYRSFYCHEVASFRHDWRLTGYDGFWRIV